MQKSSYRGENEHPGPSTFLENEIQYNQATRCGSSMENVYDDGQQDDLGHHGIIDNQRCNTDNEAQKLDGNATRCDSQSSLSVSSPPDSPVHLSHDDLDESGGSTVLSAEENKEVNLSRPEIEPLVLPTEAGKQDVRTASSSISAGDDEEWTVDNNEQLQEQEEYDEDEDGYQEEDEVHEGDDGNIDLTRELDELHLEDKETPDMMDNLVLGFNEGVEVGMPNDEFERSSRKDSSYAIKQIPIGPLEENISLDGMHSDTKILQPMDAPCHEGLDSSSRIFQETENEVQDLVIQPNTSLQAAAASNLIDHVDVTGGSGMSTEHNLPDSVNMASHSSSSQSSMPTTSVPNHAEVPVKLQFGLFSGPSLIPSPVPAIQIGSIQMPLHLHPPVCPPSLTQMHPTQPPLFQFGQLRYTSPISQGVLPLAPQSVSFVQPNVRGNFSLNLNPGVPLPVQPSQDTSGLNMMKSEVSSPLDNQSGLPRSLDLSQGNVLNEGSSTPAGESRKSVVAQHGNVEISNIGDNAARSESGFSSEDQGHKNSVHRNFKALSNKHSEGELQTVLTSSHLAAKEKDLSGLRGQTYGIRGKKYVFTVKGSNSRSAFLASEASDQDSSGYQRRPRRARTEFRIRENSEKKHSSGMVSSDHPNQVLPNSSTNGRGTGFSARNRMRKVVVNKSKQTIEFECSNSAPSSSQEIDSGNRNEKGLGKDSLMRIQNIPHSGKGNLKRNIEEDVDAPLQSGIVRVYEQPGIEAASDEDDFIEVRSKRQVLNDRREQREKEIKAKSRVAKPPRKPRSIPQSSKRNSASASGVMNNVLSDLVATEGRNLANSELSAAFSATIVSQPLAPIGTPATKTDAQADLRTLAVKSLHTSSLQATSGGGPSLVSGLMFESKNKIFDNVQASLGSWGNSCINQKVMTLTQTQLDDAMKPVQFDTCAPAGDSNSSVTDPSMPSSSLLLKDKSFSSAASPINSLLAGEKIQFGAVTSPTVIPPSSRAVSHGIGPPGPSRSEIQIPRNLSAAENDCTLFFEKEKHPGESCVHMEDCEAEAAASAVAVAAITSDEIVGNGMSTCIVSASDNKGFGGAAIDVINTGDGGQKLANQSKAEESLSVSLPADLSVENPPISLWPPLPSPQNSSSQMISHFPGGPPSHFPFYDMNPMMGGPIFAFGPHEESSSTQSQSQKSSTPASGPLGTWQQCHSGVDSFYGPPTGFTGHFITPPGGIPGVQGPPHMVVYNHFAPVGQFALLRDAEDEERRTDQSMFSTDKEFKGKRRPNRVNEGEYPLVSGGREMGQFEEGNTTDMHEISASGSRMPIASNDQSLIIRRGGHSADDGRFFIDGEMDGRRGYRRNINDEFIVDRQQNPSDFMNSPSDPQTFNRFECSPNSSERRPSNNINDDSYIVSLRSTSATQAGTDDRSAINMDSDFTLSLQKAENIPNRAGSQVNYELDDLSLMPERGAEMGSIGYDPALDYEMQVHAESGTKKNKDVMQGSKKSEKDRKSRLTSDPSDKKKTIGPIRKGKPSKPSPLDEAKVRAERLRTYKADLQKLKKEKEEEEIRRLEALKMERQKRIAARGNSVPAQSSVASQSKKQLPSKLSPSTHKGSKFTDGEPGPSSPLQRSIKPASVGSVDSHKASKPSKLNSATPSLGNRLSHSVSSLPEPKKDIGGVTPDTKASMARIRRLSEPKTSSSPLVSSVKSRHSEPKSKTKASGVPESKKISAIMNHDKSKIASLPELKIKTTKDPNVTDNKLGGNEMIQKVSGSISSTIDVAEPSRNTDKGSLHIDGDDGTVIEKTVVMLESIPTVNSSEATTLVQKENNGIFKIGRETEMVSDYAAIRAPVSSLNLDAVDKEHQIQPKPQAYEGNVSNTEKELSKFTSTSVTEKQYQAPLARVSSLEDPCTEISEYDKAPPTSMQVAATDSENVRALVADTKNLKLEKIPEVLDKSQVKEPSKGFRRLLKFGKRNHSSARSEHSIDSNNEADELVANGASSSEVQSLKNLISQDETPTANNTPQKSSRTFSLLSPFRIKTSEKKYMA